MAEIVTAIEYLTNHPEIKHGEIEVGIGPDEEIGTGADRFDVKDFGADIAYTVDGGPLGELEYETFNAAAAKMTFIGKDVHPATAKGVMVNAIQLAMDFHAALPEDEVPEKRKEERASITFCRLTEPLMKHTASISCATMIVKNLKKESK